MGRPIVTLSQSSFPIAFAQYGDCGAGAGWGKENYQRKVLSQAEGDAGNKRRLSYFLFILASSLSIYKLREGSI